MNTEIATQPEFLIRTTLLPGEYRANFRQIDRDAITIVTSRAARQITKMMAHIYMCLVDAPMKFRERDGVLRFAGEVREGKTATAWQQLIELLEVADGTAHKALTYMAEQKVIGYHSGKNGVGIRIFLNRAASSVKREGERSQKILRLVPVANGDVPVSPIAIPFKNNGRKIEDIKINPKTPSGGGKTVASSEIPDPIIPLHDSELRSSDQRGDCNSMSNTHVSHQVTTDEIVSRLRSELVPYLKTVVAREATQAAGQAAAREVGRTREWFETKALPKAVRIAQHETYDLLRKQCTLDGQQRNAKASLEVGRAATLPEPRLLTTEEIATTAEACLAMMEVQGREVETLLREMSCENGGWLLLEDVSRVREKALVLRTGLLP